MLRRSMWHRWHPASAVAVVALACITLLAACTPFWAQPAMPAATLSPGGGVTAACPAWTAATATSTVAPPATSAAQAIAAYNAARVLETPRPIRNLYSITQHLVRHSAQPIACRVRGAPRNERVGHVTTFYVVNPTQTGYHQIRATLVYVTPHVYMYLQNGASSDLSQLRASADTFERSIYPTDRAYFGSEWSPGPDDDAHITILNAHNLGPIGGYFSSEDEYPTAVAPYSNERQMIYINLDGGELPGSAFYDSTLAHEFQHMIHWYWHPADGSWTNEGASVLAEHINGYSTDGVGAAFLAQPDIMLGGWTDDQNADFAHYGAGYLFMDYFVAHFGGSGVLRQLFANPAQVPLNFDAVLHSRGFHDSFNDVFATFVVANLLNDPSVAGGIYSYPSIPAEQARVQHSVSSYPYVDGSAATPASVQQYAAAYYDFRPGGSGARTLTLTFSGAPYTPVLDNQPYGGASAEWWSNTGNDMDTTLTRAFDLSALAGRPITLNFQAWYSLEQDFDYAYVEVSTDNGQNWTPLRATSSTTSNPNGANYGYGITGVSGGQENQTCGPTPRWVPESVDLSKYAGQRIMVRFETISDDAVHCPGLALDDISIPQLGFRDAVASDNGWQARGWLRSNNMLPEQYVLQAVVYATDGAPAQVVQIPVSALTGAARYTLAGLGTQVAHVTLAVTAMAPATIVPARYTLSAQIT